jgi:uncharacterized membrane protein
MNMAFESIPNFDQYIVVAVVLFIVGLFSVMVYEKSNSSSASASASADKQEKQKQKQNKNSRHYQIIVFILHL